MCSRLAKTMEDDSRCTLARGPMPGIPNICIATGLFSYLNMPLKGLQPGLARRTCVSIFIDTRNVGHSPKLTETSKKSVTYCYILFVGIIQFDQFVT
eukprot:Gb_39919 [translate_table: standard]